MVNLGDAGIIDHFYLAFQYQRKKGRKKERKKERKRGGVGEEVTLKKEGEKGRQKERKRERRERLTEKNERKERTN